MARPTLHVPSYWARAEIHTDEDPFEKTADQLPTRGNRPSSGRNTPIGRRVEKPAPERQGGPSGQTDQCQHDRRHANK